MKGLHFTKRKLVIEFQLSNGLKEAFCKIL